MTIHERIADLHDFGFYYNQSSKSYIKPGTGFIITAELVDNYEGSPLVFIGNELQKQQPIQEGRLKHLIPE